jgi:DNA polymerase-3 subunit gamma/tau
LSAAAFNAFLKTLEEPPAYAKFILATTERHKILPTILSRCQVFDFHRISIESAVSQLRKIVANEGIVAEEEALHVIAQKADGAMRDALSIFDRIVSFSGKNITYRDVIDNLNILDYEYYFRGVDMMLAKDLPAMLLLFDEILSKGFDPQHFLSGFSDHIRNLMMCKHPNTLKLLEVAQSIANRFAQQSQQCSVSLLLNGLNILNKCELEYKSSKNARLHVELTLMKLSHIQSVIDLKSGDFDAKKKIPDGTVIPQTEPAAKPVEQPEPVIAAEIQTKEPEQETETIPILPPAPVVEPVMIRTTLKPIGGTNSASKLDKLRQHVNAQTTEDVLTEDTAQQVQQDEVSATSFSETQLIDTWKAYIGKLSESGKNSLAVIYKNSIPKLTGNFVLELTLSSQLEREMIEEDRINITPFLRSTLQNSKIDFSFIINSTIQPFKAFTAEDKFKVMADKNPLLNDLRQSFGLEFE